MNYFDYQPRKSLGSVWALCSGLAEIPESEKLNASKRSVSYEHTLELVNSALNGTVSTDVENILDFNLKAYEYVCSKNDGINHVKEAEKTLYIVDDVSTEDHESQAGFGDISERKLKVSENEYDSVYNLVSFDKEINRLLYIRQQYISTAGVDLVQLMLNALKGIPDSISDLKQVVLDNPNLSDMVSVLCEGGMDGLLIERLELAL